jgi:hypothetical protein
MIAALKREVLTMAESITYQEIVGIGRLDEARMSILRQGKKRFGRVSRKAAQAIEDINDLDRLRDVLDRMPEVNSWDELLATR